MFLQALTLNLCVPAGDTLAFFSQPADVRAAIPVEEGLRILAKAQMALVFVPVTAPEQLHHKGFCLVAVSLSCGMESLLSCQPVIPQAAALEKQVGSFH